MLAPALLLVYGRVACDLDPGNQGGGAAGLGGDPAQACVSDILPKDLRGGRIYCPQTPEGGLVMTLAEQLVENSLGAATR